MPRRPSALSTVPTQPDPSLFDDDGVLILFDSEGSLHKNMRAPNFCRGRLDMRVYVYLRCRNIQDSCNATARVFVNNPDVLIPRQPHVVSCPPSREAVAIQTFKERLKNACMRDHMEPRQIYDIYALLYEEEAALVSFNSVRNSMNRWRLQAFPANPATSLELTMQLNDPRNRGIFDHARGSIDVVVFRDVDDCTHYQFFDRALIARMGQNVKTILIDFTYKTCPVLTDVNLQLGTVMAIFRGCAIPIMWFQMSRKTTNAYIKMSQLIREALANFQIRAIVTDFELALRNALREVYGNNVHLVGCYFHFIRCLMGKLHSLNLTELVRDNEQVNEFIRKCAALPFLPHETMIDAFNIHVNNTPQNFIEGPLQPFVAYLRRFWFQRVRPINFSVFGLHTRTNNALESYHCNLQRRMGRDPQYWRWICKLKEIIKMQWTDVSALERGQAVRRAQEQNCFQEPASTTRQYALGEIGSVELIGIGSQLVGEYFNKRFRRLHRLEAEQVIDLEARFTEAIAANNGVDPEFDWDIMREFPQNEIFRMQQGLEEREQIIFPNGNNAAGGSQIADYSNDVEIDNFRSYSAVIRRPDSGANVLPRLDNLSTSGGPGEASHSSPATGIMELGLSTTQASIIHDDSAVAGPSRQSAPLMNELPPIGIHSPAQPGSAATGSQIADYSNDVEIDNFRSYSAVIRRPDSGANVLPRLDNLNTSGGPGEASHSSPATVPRNSDNADDSIDVDLDDFPDAADLFRQSDSELSDDEDVSDSIDESDSTIESNSVDPTSARPHNLDVPDSSARTNSPSIEVLEDAAQNLNLMVK
ncbi:unnamed protein product [Trichogramma brassicae]|uniref:MULE transposase domain-containing protein n=1 Tax=Trichogramma brassicae TaxID=86971 RepID=A0A6H5ITJ4_9HYME|nr:unnamed protein product [Trichogramma brassicae]